jgi:hypothetical protein
MIRSRRARRFIAALLLCAVAIPLAGIGCGRVINRTAERKIREALPDAIGPAREYRVHIENAPIQSVAGKFANVVIDGDQVQFPTGLLVDSLHIELKNVDIDAGRRKVRHIGDARFTIVVSENSLDQLIAGESPAGESIRKTRLTLGDNNIVTVTGERVTLLNVGVPFRLTGPIRAASPTRIEIDPRRLDVIGIPFSGGILNFFKSRIESSLDLRQLPVAVQLSRVTTQRGSITLAGSIDAEALLARTQAAK